MASAIIHICVAHEANKILKRNEKEFVLGSIAPDIAKQIGKSKKETHFIKEDNSDLPLLNDFLVKYKDSLDNDFNLGYYCHLYTDLLWYGFYLLKYVNGNTYHFKDGHSEVLTNEKATELVYQEYTNLNIKIIDRFNLDLSLFYEEAPIIESNIEEMPIDKIKVLIDQMGIIMEESTEEKENVLFDADSIAEFITFTTDAFIRHLKEIRVL